MTPDRPTPQQLVCDHCPRLAESVHVVPELATTEPRVVLLACSQHDPGGESWNLSEVGEDTVAALREIRPDLPPDLHARAQRPTVHWRDVPPAPEHAAAPSPAPFPAPAPPQAPPRSGAATTRNSLSGVAIVVGIVLAILYFNGSLDKPLSSVGLNRNPCVQNAFGATFCGEDAKRVCKQFGGEACDDLGYDTSGSATDELDSLQQDVPSSESSSGSDYGSDDSDGDGLSDDLDSAPYDPSSQ